MILGVGVDLIEVSRIREAFERHGQRFRARIYTETETGYCDAMASPLLHYAARWAAKEAFSKALGFGVAQGMSWREIGIRNDGLGAPRMELAGQAARLASEKGAWGVHVSLSHTAGMAVAVVILEGERPEESALPPEGGER